MALGQEWKQRMEGKFFQEGEKEGESV